MIQSSRKKPLLQNKSSGVSLARALSKLGIASRTQASDLISQGKVSVNGQQIRDPNKRISLNHDRLMLDGVVLQAQQKRYLVLNKPRGLITTKNDEKGRDTVYKCLSDIDKKLSPVGRLDMASEGLLLFTNDTQWAQKILDPTSHLAKTYHVQISGHPNEEQLTHLRNGVELDTDTITRPAVVDVIRRGDKTCWLEITLHEGINRQIRRMIEIVGYQVMRLIRIRIGPVELDQLAKGASRDLTEVELESINRQLK